MTSNGRDGRGLYFEELEVGMSDSFAKPITEQDVETFAEISGDNNPVHLDAEYAATTMFKERIAHGILTASLLSAVLGTKLPGPGCIYLSQTLKFKAPVKLGEEVVATATVKELIEGKGRVVIACDCSVDGKTVLEGEAVMMVPRRPT